jgi:hypothetical protein
LKSWADSRPVPSHTCRRPALTFSCMRRRSVAEFMVMFLMVLFPCWSRGRRSGSAAERDRRCGPVPSGPYTSRPSKPQRRGAGSLLMLLMADLSAAACRGLYIIHIVAHLAGAFVERGRVSRSMHRVRDLERKPTDIWAFACAASPCLPA